MLMVTTNTIEVFVDVPCVVRPGHGPIYRSGKYEAESEARNGVESVSFRT